MIKKTGMVLGPIETWVQLKHIEQLGLDDLIKLADYRAARVFSLNEAEADKVSPREVMDRWFRAADERNARLVYLKPKIEEKKDPEDNFDTNLKYIAEFSRLISRRGFDLGAVVPMEDYSIGRIRLLMLVSGTVAGAVLIINQLIDIGKKYLYGLFALGMAGCFALQLAAPSLADKAFALGAAVVFPSLAMLYVLHYCKRKLRDGDMKDWKGITGASVLLLLKASMISLIGAVHVASMLSATRYLLEMDIFRGVKLAHIIPLLVFTIAYFMVIGYHRDRHQNIGDELKTLLDTPIYVKYALLLGLAAVAGYVYLGRTGHTAGRPYLALRPSFVPSWNNAAGTAPTKEFLVAHPVLIIMAAAAMTA